MKIHLIVNENARIGARQSLLQLLETKMSEAGVEYEIHKTKREGDAKRLARELSLSPEKKTIWVVGGDGTLNEALSGLVLKETLCFGVVPAGSGNDFARGMGLPKKTEAAIELLLKTKKTRFFDVGRVELLDVPSTAFSFAGSCGCGYDAEVCHAVNQTPLKRWLNRLHAGKLSYLVTAVLQVFRNPRFSMTLIANGISRSFQDVIFVCFMIHPYEGGGLRMAPSANPVDGKLSLVIAHGISRFRVLTLLPTLLKGTHIKHDGVVAFESAEVELIADRAVYVHTDGEVACQSRHFRVGCLTERLQMPDTTKSLQADEEATKE